MSFVNIKINGNDVKTEKGTTILEACKTLGINIPTLCHMDLHMEEFGAVNKNASCRVCLVEVEGRPTLAPSCSEKVVEGMVITTDSPRAVNARRMSVELLLSDHPQDCLHCAKNLNCDLQKLAHDLGVRETAWGNERVEFEKDTSSKAIVRDPNKCIMCRKCEVMCNEVQTCGILSGVNRGFDSFVSTAFNLPLNETSCTYCGQCVAVCPTAALTEVNEISQVWSAIANEKKHVVVQIAPAIRVAIGEEFGMAAGSITTGKLATALRKLGFDGVFDTDFAADLTIFEEASELVHRIEHGGTLPILTSCCPAWVNFFEHQFPDLLDIPSSCQSPQIMFGAVAKTYYAEKINLDPKDMTVVSIMPCVAKKYEAKREELSTDGNANVDHVLTTREFALMLKEAGIDFANLEEGEFDSILGESTGAAVIFGTTGGVIEAAVRTAYEWITGEILEDVEFTALRGLDGIRSADLQIGDLTLKIGIAHGLGNARKLLESIQRGENEFHAIEIMACPGGCIGGGGQPYHHGDLSIIEKRYEAIYTEDRSKAKRKSHENEEVLKMYQEFLGKPYGEKAHHLLHTKYTKKERI
jgi:NADH-quinone oxidoreductase subunit G/NADP-reducing hydrogenase subunit HndD